MKKRGWNHFILHSKENEVYNEYEYYLKNTIYLQNEQVRMYKVVMLHAKWLTIKKLFVEWYTQEMVD